MTGRRKRFGSMNRLAPLALLLCFPTFATSQQKTVAEKVSGTFCAKHHLGRTGKRFLTPFPRPSPTSTGAQVQITGEVARPMTFSAEDLAKLPRQTVKAKAHDGTESQYEGVALAELLTKSGVPMGKDLRGKAMALYLVVEASDDYRAVFALAELDSAFADRVVLLADHRDGKPLSAKEGPFQIIVPGEKKHARWVRQVIRLRVGRA
jgi:DMSO/TMAO reductase YedYZ molybdopterin-dependent catalytic subunit